MPDNITQIPAPRVEFVDPKTGLISRQWFRYFNNVNTIIGGGDGIIAVINGGTGFASYAVGDILYANTTTSLAKLPDVALGNVLLSGGLNLPPYYGKVDLTIHVTGVLPAVNGGTGISSYAVGDLVYADTTTTLAKLPDVTTGNALISGGVDTAPAWGKIGLTTHVSGVLTVPNGGSGAATLTGYVKGNGAAAFTASPTIPNTDITGLGTISTKNTGASGSFTTVDLKTVTVVDGIITSIV